MVDLSARTSMPSPSAYQQAVGGARGSACFVRSKGLLPLSDRAAP